MPIGVREELTGGTHNFKNHFKDVFKWYAGEEFLFGGIRMGYNFDLGVCREGKILSWGFAST
jgi:hypothetical protein